MPKKKIELDELELFIGIAKAEGLLSGRETYAELRQRLKEEIGIEPEYDDIRLLYEPSFDEDYLDREVHLNAMGMYY